MTLLADPPVTAAPGPAPARSADLARLRGRATTVALVLAGVAALAQTLGTVVAGRLAERPTSLLVGVLALCLVGAAVLDTAGRAVWAGVVDRAEGRVRGDLLDAALDQPLPVLAEQAVGEVLDRVDGDTAELGTLLRRAVWDLVRTVLRTVPAWVVAGLTWWPAWLLFPLVGGLTVLVVRPLTAEVAQRKLEEEVAWTDSAAAVEEGVAARDDLRAALGQAYLLRRSAELSAEVHRRAAATLRAAARLNRRTGLLLYSLLAGTAVAGALLVDAGRLSTAELVTLFLVTTSFVGQIDRISRHLPELQAGLGALTRLRQLLEAEPEPVGGVALPDGPLPLDVRDLSFAYPQGAFALDGVTLSVPAGQVVALVGRTGSGKSTLASLVSRAVEPPAGTVLLGGVDVRDVDLQQLRAAVGVITQRTELLAATLAENVALFADVPRARVQQAVEALGLQDWVAGLPAGLDTPLGPGGTPLSAGEEQLVAFARLLVRDVRLVVLDEATARMDPVTEQRVVRASARLLAGRTGIVIAHRLATTARADLVAVLDGGRVVQAGPRAVLAAQEGPFRALLDAAGPLDLADGPAPASVTRARRTGAAPDLPPPAAGPGLARRVVALLRTVPAWGLLGALLFLLSSLVGPYGTATGLLWGLTVTSVDDGRLPVLTLAALVAGLLAAPLLVAEAFRRYIQWWTEGLLRVRLAVLTGQTGQRRLPRTPPGEVVARALDAQRLLQYADRWVDLLNGVAVAVVTALAAQSLLAGGVLGVVLVVSGLVSALGSPAAGRTAAAASRARAGFGRALASALEAARTVKLAAATPDVRRHLRTVDGGRVEAAVREHRVQAVLDGLPQVLVEAGVVAGWAVYLVGGWDLATALLVTTTVAGFDWFGRVAGAVITEAPGTRAWARATSVLSGGGDLVAVPRGVDLVAGTAPAPVPPAAVPLRRLELAGVTAVHDDGTVGVQDVDLVVDAGELVLLLGPVGAGKSSLLAALAGLVHHDGAVRWNGVEVDDPQVFLRPGQVAHVAQVPRVLSGSFADNLRLDHPREVQGPVDDARLSPDVTAAGGAHALVGHRGVRLSGGQVQRLALARALSTRAELLLADDVSSALDARTEVELWQALRARGTTVVGATSKRAALAQADRVVVLDDGRVADVGPWAELAGRWGHLAG